MLTHKTYFNGESLEVGDIPLAAMQQGSTVTSSDSTVGDISLNLIWVNERHIDLFELDDRYSNSLEKHMPTIKLKE